MLFLVSAALACLALKLWEGDHTMASAHFFALCVALLGLLQAFLDGRLDRHRRSLDLTEEEG